MKSLWKKIVSELAADGAKVAFTYLSSPEQANGLAAKIGKQGEAVTMQADSGDASRVEAAINLAKSRFSQPDIVVANAASRVRGGRPVYARGLRPDGRGE
jgi:3-oxoacyl-[acyl-carrier protein] reductase